MQKFPALVAHQDGDQISARVETFSQADLRGIALLGIDSVQLPIGPRRDLWARLGDALRPRHLDVVTTEVDVEDVVGVLDQSRAGALTGRAVVRVAGGF